MLSPLIEEDIAVVSIYLNVVEGRNDPWDAGYAYVRKEKGWKLQMTLGGLFAQERGRQDVAGGRNAKLPRSEIREIVLSLVATIGKQPTLVRVT